MNDNDPIPFLLFAVFAVVLIIFLHDMASTSVQTTTDDNVHVGRFVPCGNPKASDDALSYFDVEASLHDHCDQRRFPYCHTLPIPFYNFVPEDLIDNNWTYYSCYRDLVPDDRT